METQGNGIVLTLGILLYWYWSKRFIFGAGWAVLPAGHDFYTNCLLSQIFWFGLSTTTNILCRYDLGQLNMAHVLQM